MSRRNVTQRVKPPKSAATVRCQGCSARLGIGWPTESGRRPGGSYDAVWLGASDYSRGSVIAGTVGGAAQHGLKAIGHDDWNSVTCRRCKRVWQGRDQYLHDLLSSAPGGEVRLGQPVRATVPAPALNSSRVW